MKKVIMTLMLLVLMTSCQSQPVPDTPKETVNPRDYPSLVMTKQPIVLEKVGTTLYLPILSIYN